VSQKPQVIYFVDTLLWLNVFLQVKHSCADLLEEWFSIAWLADTDDRNGNES